MTKSIRFRAKSPQRKIYYPGDFKFSSVQSRSTLISKEETRKKYGLPKKQKIVTLNQKFLQRMLSKSHTYEYHSPEKIKKQYQTMWKIWAKKLNREKVSIKYINTYSLHKY